MTGREQVAKLCSAGLALCVGLGLLSGCTGTRQSVGFADDGVPAGSFQLVGFDSCDEALTGLRAAAKAVVGPYGFGAGPIVMDRANAEEGAPPPAPQAAAGDAARESAAMPGQQSAPTYSGTNTHEAGVDEPDLVKTDGRRIVTVSAGVLRVVDAARRYVTGTVDLAGSLSDRDLVRFAGTDLLLSGDKALVLMDQQYRSAANRGGPAADVPSIAGDVPAPVPPEDPDSPRDWPVVGPRLILVDLAGPPRVLSTFRVDGALIDARQVGSTVRVVIRSSPRFTFPYDVFPSDTFPSNKVPSDKKIDEADRLKANRAIIDEAGIEDWLPRIEVTTAGRIDRPQINCGAINRPEVYTGTNLLTVLTFDLAAANLRKDGLGDGQPTMIVADGDTVYSNGPSLYVASDQRWRISPMWARADVTALDERTEIYKFDTSSPGRPTFAAGGSVPGYLINQYALSEWEGRLRVATTRGQAAGRGNEPATESGVYVLAQSGGKLTQVGSVEGLGKGERIYAVRFAGPIGYVVTFRQVDPLYTVDLRDPSNPVVRGELKIPGYSAYLHPAGATRLIGIGQNANGSGQVSGTQVSLFDVSDLAEPRRLASYTLSGAHSEAEFDPHAFLYWPADGLLVVPLQAYNEMGALVLRVSGAGITEVGMVRHPGTAANPGYPGQIRRSLIIGQTLWTVSDGGLMAHDLRTLTQLAWIGFF